jgi:uncharacterized membrane protein YhaH (DUF805 family)
MNILKYRLNRKSFLIRLLIFMIIWCGFVYFKITYIENHPVPTFEIFLRRATSDNDFYVSIFMIFILFQINYRLQDYGFNLIHLFIFYWITLIPFGYLYETIVDYNFRIYFDTILGILALVLFLLICFYPGDKGTNKYGKSSDLKYNYEATNTLSQLTFRKINLVLQKIKSLFKR